jgi:FkbM family methyltransferase
MKSVVKKILNPFLGRRELQGIFEALHAFSLAGMNVGLGGSTPENTGEAYFINRILAKKLRGIAQPILFDVGANIGGYSIELTKAFPAKNVKIHSFEPSPTAYTTLEYALSSYENVFAHNIGFSDVETEAKLYTNTLGSVIGSVYNRNVEHHGGVMEETETIQLTTIDKFCKENGIEEIHFLKLDVEGHEMNVFRGASEMIKNDAIDIIQFEFGSCNVASRTYFQDYFLLLREKYTIYRLLANGLYPVVSYKDRYEMFLATNYVAIRNNVKK